MSEVWRLRQEGSSHIQDQPKIRSETLSQNKEAIDIAAMV